jgi:hypothetical protein
MYRSICFETDIKDLENEIDKRSHQRHHLGYHPFGFTGNESWESKLKHWDHPYAFEHLDVSRPHREEVKRQKSLFELESYYQEWVETCERLVVYRANPEYNKEVTFAVKMSVGTMCPQQWNHVKSRLSLTSPPQKISSRATTGIDNDGDKRGEQLDSIEWFEGNPIPNLRTPNWGMIKWWSEKNACCQRALITSFGLQRHSWTGSVFVKFTYLTWSFNESTKSWTLI